MSTDTEVFGHLPSGEPVYRVTLKGGGLTAKILTWGAVIQDLRLEGHVPPLVLGFEDFDSYPAHSSYFGATPGRNANRIGGGRFTLDGKAYQLELNEKGVTHLHGGSDNIAKRNWTIVESTADSVTLRITDPDGRAGYPGNCTYTLKSGGTLNVVYESLTDAPTLANVCQHSYFNLDGGVDALGHDIMIAAEHYLPTDEQLIPTGDIRAVAGTIFDLRQMTSMRRQMEGNRIAYDHGETLRGARAQHQFRCLGGGADDRARPPTLHRQQAQRAGPGPRRPQLRRLCRLLPRNPDLARRDQP
jgi:aldose 1-epimerase